MKFRSRLSLLSPFLFLFFTASKTPDLSCTCLTEIMGGTPLHTDREEQLLLLESNPNLSDLTEPVYKSELVTLLTNKQIEEVKYEPLKPYKGRVFLEEREFYAWTEVFFSKDTSHYSIWEKLFAYYELPLTLIKRERKNIYKTIEKQIEDNCNVRFTKRKGFYLIVNNEIVGMRWAKQAQLTDTSWINFNIVPSVKGTYYELSVVYAKRIEHRPYSSK